MSERRHPLSDKPLAVARWGATQEKRQSAFVRDGVPENAVAVYSMSLHPDDYEAARFALDHEIEAMIYRSRFAQVKLLKDVTVPRGHALLQSMHGHAGFVRFR